MRSGRASKRFDFFSVDDVLAVSPDGRMVATSDTRGGAHLYEVATEAAV